jgi:hypothetical protein
VRGLVGTAALPSPLDIVIDDLDHSRTAETRTVAAVHHTDRKLSQTIHRLQIFFGTCGVRSVAKLTIVNGIAGEQQTRRLFPKLYLAGRMAG